MFQLFRSRKQTFRIMLAVIVAPIIITMVVTLIPGIFGSTGSGGVGDTVLAEVQGESVTVREAQNVLQDYVQQRRLPPGAYNFVAPKIVEDLVTDRAMLLEAERLGLGVTEAELADLLRTSLPFLFQGGSFLGKDQYAAFVRDRFRKTIPEFEAEVRKDLVLTKLRQLVTDGVVIAPGEVEKEYRRRNEKAKIDFAAVSAASLEASMSSTQAEIEEYFNKNRAIYTLPERRSFQYMVIDDAKVSAKVQVTPQELERYYNENRDRYRMQDRARVTHILFKTTEKSEDEVKQIEARAQDILKQARSGKDFAELAKANSEDTVSAAKGGEVGWITRGQTVPEFEQKAFSMKPGEISDLVKTQYGFHVIKLLEREEARLKTFAEVEGSIREELTRERIDTERSRLAEGARAAASRNATDLEEAGREVGAPVFTAKLLERGSSIAGLGVEPALMDSIFAAFKGQVLGPIQMAGKSVIALVTEIQPSRQAELAEVADRVRQDSAAAKAREAAEARARELAERARAAGDLRQAAREFRLELKTSDSFTREGSIPGVGPGSMLAEAFTAPIGTVLGPVSAGADHIVYRVVARQEPDTAASEEEKNLIRDQLLGNRQSEAFEIFKEELRARLKREGKIKIFQERVDRFVSTNRS